MFQFPFKAAGRLPDEAGYNSASASDRLCNKAPGLTAIKAVMLIFIGLVSSLALANEAAAQKVVRTDVYIAVPPVEGEPFFQLFYGPRDSILIPKDAFGSKGVAKYDDKFEGAKGIKKKVETTFSQVNDKYKDADVKFEIRNIYFIQANHPKLKSHFDNESQNLTLAIDNKTNKSALMKDFKQAVVANDSFNILITNLKEESEGEPGRGEVNGNTSVVSMASAFNEMDKGQVVIHEFGHNLGLPHKSYSEAEKLTHGMSSSLPNRARPPGAITPSDPKLTKTESDAIKKRIGKGLYDAYLNNPVKAKKKKKKTSSQTSLLLPGNTAGGQQTALSVPASNGIPVGDGNQTIGIPPGTPGSLFNISAGGFSGQLDRRPTAMLGTELGGVIARTNFVYVDNDADVDGFFVDARVDTTALDNQLWGGFGPSTSFATGFQYLHLESNARQQIGSTMLEPGSSLLIFSPQGVDGGLGGGLNAGMRDAVNIAYNNDLEYSEYNLTKQMSVRSGPVTIRPGLRLGYGQTSVDEWFSGQVAGINQDFAYSNQIDVDSVIFGGGLDVELALGQVGGIPLSYFGGLSGAAHFNDQSGQSTLALNGLVNAQETQILGGSETTGSLELESGLAFRFADTVELKLGGKYRHFETPGVEILPQQTARITWQDASEITGYARVNIGFGGPPAGSSGAFYASDRRLKRDIAQIATLENGIRLYRFRYVWGDEFYVGVIAQDLLTQNTFKDAVIQMPNGFYAVNYAMLGLKMVKYADLRGSSLAAAVLQPATDQVGSLASSAR